MKKNIIIISILAIVITVLGIIGICSVTRTKKAERMAIAYYDSIYNDLIDLYSIEENSDLYYNTLSYFKYTQKIDTDTYLVTLVLYTKYGSNFVPIKVNLRTGSVFIFGVFEGDVE